MDVGRELVMALDDRFRIQTLENLEGVAQRFDLCGGARVVRAAVAVETAFVTDAYAVKVETFGMGTRLSHRTCLDKVTVTEDVKVVADVLEPPRQVVGAEAFYRIGTVTAGGAAMHYEKLDFTGQIGIFFFHRTNFTGLRNA